MKLYSAALLGRSDQLEVLFERTRASAAVSFVAGPAGIGKTALLRAFSQARGDSLALEIEAGQRVPLSPLLDALGVAHDATLPGDLESLNALLFDALEALAERGVAALIVDNAHALDAASLRFLRTAIEREAALPLHLIVSSRLAADLPHGPQRDFANDAQSDVRAIVLSPLDDDAIERLVEAHVPGALTPHSRGRLVAAAEGNPQAALEFAEASTHARVSNGELAVRSVSAAVMRKLATLDEADRRAIEIAAAIGRRFDPALLAAALERTVLETVPALRAAVDAGLIVEVEGSGDVRFRHELTRDAIYASLDANERRNFHATIAENVERFARGPAADAVAYDQWAFAERFDRAEGPGRRTIARALARFAYEDAIDIGERLSAIATRPEDRAELLDAMATAHSYAGRLPQARELIARGIALCSNSSNRELRARLAHRYGAVAYNMFDTAASDAALDTIPGILGEGSTSPWLFRGYSSKALAAVQRGEPETAAAYLAKADEVRSADVTPPDLATYERVRGEVAAALGDVAGWRERSLRSTALADESGQMNRQVTVRISQALEARALGQIEMGLDVAAAARRAAEIGRLPDYAAYARAVAGWLLLERGEIDAARSDARLALERGGLAAEIATIVGMHCAALQLDEGAFERLAASEPIENAMRGNHPLQLGAVATALAAGSFALGQTERAAGVLTRSLPSLVGAYGCSELLALAPELGSTGDIGAARALFARRALGPRDAAYAELFEARAAHRDGHVRRAHRRAIDAAESFDRLGMHTPRAHALLAAGRTAEALALARRIGDLSLPQRVEAWSMERNARGRERAALTRREEQVAAMLDDRAATNRDIAERLSISERTVDAHVATILRKTGAATRHEVGAILRATSKRD